ncbi:MAG: arsenate reductase ArsC [Planctomycetota bacterium]|nr:protein-tyrosine-phosphatase [Planctomycetota bacterium]MDP6369029.1 arsenate reductase ArsC [Planctomycetota bacterium]MDP6519515.1 arsenate reductase ArsC [Planctomycetota bacterium]MDP6838020.1 arsenate reductase ArsC [Planctomycetota bacterium]
MTDRPRILFLCTGNSCRSQMAQGWLRHLAGERLTALSAGTRPAGVNPMAVEAMARAGVDISGQRSKALAEVLERGCAPQLVISVCAAAEAACPVLSGATSRLHWPFPDPARAEGSGEERARVFDNVCADLRRKLESWLAEGAPF